MYPICMANNDSTIFIDVATKTPTQYAFTEIITANTTTGLIASDITTPATVPYQRLERR